VKTTHLAFGFVQLTAVIAFFLLGHWNELAILQSFSLHEVKKQLIGWSIRIVDTIELKAFLY
jgi:hypothetical protein